MPDPLATTATAPPSLTSDDGVVAIVVPVEASDADVRRSRIVERLIAAAARRKRAAS